MDLAGHAVRHLPPDDRVWIEQRAIDPRAGRLDVARDVGGAHARTVPDAARAGAAGRMLDKRPTSMGCRAWWTSSRWRWSTGFLRSRCAREDIHRVRCLPAVPSEGDARQRQQAEPVDNLDVLPVVAPSQDYELIA